VLGRLLEVRWALENLAGMVEGHWAVVDLVGLLASEVEEETDHYFAGNSDREGRNNRAEGVRMAFLESLDQEESHLVVDHSRDHIGDNSFGTVVVVDVGGVVGNSAEEMEADFGVEGLVVMAG
jgi:hypothetical protein